MKERAEHRTTGEESLARRHEVTDAHFGRILMTGFGLLGLMVLGLVYSDILDGVFSATSPEPGAPTEVLISPAAEDLPPEPRVEPEPHANLVMLHAREDSVLNGYGWVNRDSGLVRVPIKKAMSLVVEKGLLKSR